MSYWNRKIPINVRVSKIDLFLRIFVYIGPKFFYKFGRFRRAHKALSHPSQPFFNEDFRLPEIEVTLDCAKKDFDMLKIVINHALQNILNPVIRLSVVVPSDSTNTVKAMLSEISESVNLQICSEDEVVSEKIRNNIQRMFPERYGWILHQFLTLQQVLNCRSTGILSIDSDTILLRPMAFVNMNHVQILMESLEYNAEYYSFLNKINPLYPLSPQSHVTHYSFFQPDLMNEIMRKSSIFSLEDFLIHIENFADLHSTSSICIDREFYAIGLQIYYPEYFTLVKFSNISVTRKMIFDPNFLKRLASKYNSISAHSYLN